MFWVVQSNLLNPQTLRDLVVELTAARTPYVLATLIPFLNELETEVFVPEGPVFAYGSTGLGVVAKDKGWAPGYYDENLDYQLMLQRYGDFALNAGAVVGPLGVVEPQFESFFIRPVLDNKSFPGCSMTRAELDSFRTGVAAVESEPGVTLTLADAVVIAPEVPIDAEYRFFIIDGRVVTGSLYKVGDRVVSRAEVPQVVADFAQARADQWSPNAAYALDIAQTPDGLKVLECNSANSAGFYASDLGRFVAAVNNLGR